MGTFIKIAALRKAAMIAKSDILTAATTAGWSWGEGFVCKREFSVDERKKAAKEGAAMSDGSFPIYNASDLHHAISLVGMSNHSETAVKAHIKARAKALCLDNELPADWRVEKTGGVSKADGDESAKKAGIEVETDDPEPKHGIYSHSLGAHSIGHTVKAVANGTIAWTAVPSNGKIKGGFKKHDDAKQYLADQHVDGVKTAHLAASFQPRVDRSSVHKADMTGLVSKPATPADILSMKRVILKANSSPTIRASNAAEAATQKAHAAMVPAQPDYPAAVQAHLAAAAAHDQADQAHQQAAQQNAASAPAVSQAHTTEARYHFQQAHQHRTAARDIQSSNPCPTPA